MLEKNKEAFVFTDASEFIKWVEVQKRFSKKKSLDNMLYYASLFDNPQNKFKAIHVTGTNGKGSTVTSIASVFRSAGYKVATYTSPYVVCFNERIGYDGHYIIDEDLVKYANMIVEKYPIIEASGHELPGFFDFITLLAFLFFADLQDLDIAIIEVGMGGRLDATNIITPIVSIITNVAYDHMEQLGNTLELICNEKLGIVKNDVPLITGSKDVKLQEQMALRCKEMGSLFIKPDYESLKIKKLGLDGSVFSYKGFEDVKISLIGKHQIENALVVIECIEYCRNLSNDKKRLFDISNELLYEGLISTRWPGRLEKVSNEPLIYLDGGHNIDCIERVCEFIKDLDFNSKRAVVAISNDKAKKEMIDLLDNTFDEIIFTHYSYHRSAADEDLFELSKNKNKKIIDNLDECINYCNEHIVDFTIFMGSLYLVSEIRPQYLKKN